MKKRKSEDNIYIRRDRKRKNELILKTIISVLILMIVFLLVILIREAALPGLGKLRTAWEARVEERNRQISSAAGDTEQEPALPIASARKNREENEQEVLNEAARAVAQYDYDKAVEILQNSAYYTSSQAMQTKVEEYRRLKESCVSYPLDQVTHVFFHTMIRDTSLAFDGDGDEGGYNQVMTTMSEFEKIMQAMYEKGYVMVSLHDMCTVNADGTVSRGDIRLPAGKKAFVLSQDDVSYYHYMDGDGFAQKLVLDENGKVKNSYRKTDGTTELGDFDMVPWIDTFVEQHPDFAYHGHKGIIALTGYEGVLGYRTDEVYKTKDPARVTEWQKWFFDANPDFDEQAWQKEVDEATRVADAMKAEGWEFASHTWGHISPAARGLDVTKTDTERWKKNIAPIVGDTDVIIFAFGADIGDWHPYTSDNQLFSYFKSQGYNIYCNVDSSQYWVQFGENFMRMGRRNLDGYRMYYNPDMVSDLFSVDEVWDSSRPTPVPAM